MTSEWDVAVVGAGPAGSMAALRLARQGHRVALVDKHEFPREKVCGDGLIPDALGCLGRAGLLPAVEERARALDLTAVFSPARRRVAVRGRFLTIKRLELDSLLRNAAVAQGAEFTRGRVDLVESHPRGPALVHLRGASAPIVAKIAIVATGADVSLPSSLGLVESGRASAAAVRCYVTSDHPLAELVISYDRSIMPGYAWIFPLASGQFNVGCGLFLRGRSAERVDLRAAFDRFVRSFPLAREVMERATHVTPLRGAALRCGLTGSVAHREGPVIAIGEAIATTFPFTGEGIGKAMHSGEIAAELVHEALAANDIARLAELPRRIAALDPRYRGYRMAEAWLARPWLAEVLAHRAQRSPFLRDALAGVLEESVDPRLVFSVRGLVRSLWA